MARGPWGYVSKKKTPSNKKSRSANKQLSKTEQRKASQIAEGKQKKSIEVQIRAERAKQNKAYKNQLQQISKQINHGHDKVTESIKQIQHMERRVQEIERLEKIRGRIQESRPWMPSSMRAKEFSPRPPTNASIDAAHDAAAGVDRRTRGGGGSSGSSGSSGSGKEVDWLPTRAVDSLDPTSKFDILYDARTARPMNARMPDDYLSMLAKRAKKPRPSSSARRQRVVRNQQRRLRPATAAAAAASASSSVAASSVASSSSTRSSIISSGNMKTVERFSMHRNETLFTGISTAQNFRSRRLQRASDRVEEKRIDRCRKFFFIFFYFFFFLTHTFEL